MGNPKLAKASLTAAVAKFIAALEQYQSATLAINAAAQRMGRDNLALTKDVEIVVRAAAPFLTGRRDGRS